MDANVIFFQSLTYTLSSSDTSTADIVVKYHFASHRIFSWSSSVWSPVGHCR